MTTGPTGHEAEAALPASLSVERLAEAYHVGQYHGDTKRDYCITGDRIAATAILAALGPVPDASERLREALECPAAKHHRMVTRNSSRIVGWNDEGPEYGPEEVVSDKCTACGHDFRAALQGGVG